MRTLSAVAALVALTLASPADAGMVDIAGA